MAVYVELTRFKVDADKTEAMLAARPGMLADFRADRDGFLGADLVRLANEQWLDIVRWQSAEDFAVSRGKGANRPGIAAFFATLGELVGDEQGTLA